jgi:alkaline phosphatase D
MHGLFQHGVASGDPLQDRIILWTRITNEKDVKVDWELSTDTDFKTIIQAGETTASAEQDYCVHIDPSGLQAGTRYFYRFHTLGETSPTGRTKTLPADDVTA